MPYYFSYQESYRFAKQIPNRISAQRHPSFRFLFIRQNFAVVWRNISVSMGKCFPLSESEYDISLSKRSFQGAKVQKKVKIRLNKNKKIHWAGTICFEITPLCFAKHLRKNAYLSDYQLLSSIIFLLERESRISITFPYR